MPTQPTADRSTSPGLIACDREGSLLDLPDQLAHDLPDADGSVHRVAGDLGMVADEIVTALDELAALANRLVVERDDARDLLREARSFVAEMADDYYDTHARSGSVAHALLAKIDAALGGEK
jgi:ABC-type transporter Mla subunit MlaD